MVRYTGGADWLSPNFHPGSRAVRRIDWRPARPRTVEVALGRAELSAACQVVARVLDEVPAELEEAALFGSKSRGAARNDSDVDILLVFRSLPPDREPQAGLAEAIAEEVARSTGVPVTVWSVALIDFREGLRTPMLVDALVDALPLWSSRGPLAPVAFTPADALRCADALLDRVAEGSSEFAWHVARGDPRSASGRARDDIVRLCTAILLAQGVTRPRRGEAIDALMMSGALGMRQPAISAGVLDWVKRSYDDDRHGEELPMNQPPGGLGALAATVDALRPQVIRAIQRLRNASAAELPPATPFSQCRALDLHDSLHIQPYRRTPIRAAT